jgi:hypothetical protein
MLSFLESSLDGETNQVFRPALNPEDAVTRCSSDQSSAPLLRMMAQREPWRGVALMVGTVVQLLTTKFNSVLGSWDQWLIKGGVILGRHGAIPYCSITAFLMFGYKITID